MADLTITAANVQIAAGAQVKRGTAGAAITAGQAVYVDPADGLVKLASNAAEGTAACTGVALHAAATGQPVSYAWDGPIDVGATLTVGMPYVLSAAGGISPVSDAASNDWMTYLGVATAADNLDLKIHVSGVQLASDVT